MNIKVLGTGCAKCMALEKTVNEVIKEMNLDVTVEEVKDMNRILEYPILTTPGLVIDEEVVLYGRVPKKDEVRGIINKAAAK
ncbi:MAG: TM0996/MTH895 family glutaredoxin-like protein [Dehalococcoidia bacterium]|nr:TM0996/MTH895 family glutaredoxin-like protein [Dehalococcoidia bacterium]